MTTTPGRWRNGFAVPVRRLGVVALVAGLVALELLAGCNTSTHETPVNLEPQDKRVPSTWHNLTSNQTIPVEHTPCTNVCTTSEYSEQIAPDGTAITALRVRLTWTGDPPCGELMVAVSEIESDSRGRNVATYRGSQPLVFELSNITLLEEEKGIATRVRIMTGHASWSSTPVTALEVSYTLESAALVHPLQAEDYSAANRTANGPDQGTMRC